MRRVLKRTLQPLVRSLTTGVAPTELEVDAASKVAPKLGEAASRVSVPLSKPLPGVDSGAKFLAPLEEPPTEVTTLPNGLRIVSEASVVSPAHGRAHAACIHAHVRATTTPPARPAQGPTVNVGLYVDCGSIYETAQTSGVVR